MFLSEWKWKLLKLFVEIGNAHILHIGKQRFMYLLFTLMINNEPHIFLTNADDYPEDIISKNKCRSPR